MKHGFHVFVVVLAALVLTGCPSLWNTELSDKPPSAEELFKTAESQFDRKEYKRALESYERLKSAFPDFKNIPKAYMRIADCLFNQGSYDHAISRYLQFIELYPNHKEAPRAKFQVALAYFNQIKNTDLDSSVVRRAADSFKALSGDPNAGEWAKQAEEKHRECMRKLGEKELYKAKHYVKMSNYRAARLAAKRILEEYPKLGLDEEAKELVERLKDKDK
ncbi:MAG: outer membrane protein assembly factor BamD [Desulfomonile tiedjei]|nr:outer membrane protein assembly factor BamD [Desulfomonile tiedjei]